MKHREGSLFQTLTRIDGFLTSHAEMASLVGSPARTTLVSAIGALNERMVAQDQALRSSKGETSRQVQLREVLRTQMQAVAAAARANLENVPDFAALRMPASNSSSLRLANAAKAMGIVAARHEQVFVDAGLRQDFIARLNTAADAVESSRAGRDAHKGTVRNATEALATLTKAGTRAIAILDPLVRDIARGNAPLLAEWRSTKRISSKPGPVQTTVASSPTPTVAPTSTPEVHTPAA